MEDEIKRLFFAFSVEAPWPHEYPKGRLVDEKSRHITFAFLGNVHPVANLSEFPKPDLLLGPAGKTDRLLFLPPHRARVVASHVTWLSDGEKLNQLQKKALDWLESLGYQVDRRPLLSHITLARAPFDRKAWEDWFEELPCIITGIHLYESVGNLTYQSIWEIPLTAPFEEIEHTADIAFQVRGKNFDELYRHGAVAMSFKHPPFLSFIESEQKSDLNQVVKGLNQMISACDLNQGCPFKAVSYHSKIREESNGLINWEMIVDV
jgi:2'-5' RNA ligase